MADRTTDALTPAGRIAAARASVARQARIARRRLWAERLTQALWPIWALAAAFLGLALLGAPQSLPFILHVALLAGFASGFVWLVWRAIRAWRTPSAAEARARLDGDARDRPVVAIGDALAAGVADPASQGIWAEHQARMAERAAQAKAPPTDLRVSDRDRFALRHAAALALAAGAIAQLGDDGARLAEALSPVGAPALAAQAPQPSFEAWASPPVHTGMAPLYLTERVEEPDPIRLPVGSEIVLRVFEAGGQPTLTGSDATFAEQGAGAWSATVTLTGDAEMTLSAPGADFGGWRFAAIADAPPTIAFTAPPTATRGGSLTFGFETTDDYGVTGAQATVTLDPEAEGPRGLAASTVFEPASFELPLPLRGAAETAAETVTQDLTEHPWAGLPVTVTLTAVDGAGQEATATARTTLPQRRFLNPLAKAIIEQRRELAWTTEAAERVTRVLDAVTAHPDDIFTDAAPYLTVRTARRRLGYAIEGGAVAEETPGVAELLWQAALRIEDGDLSEAERRLRQLQEELSEAIENGASDEEIAEIMDELRQALNDYLRQLAQEMMRQQAEGGQPPQPMDPNQMMTQQDLQDMLDQLQEAIENGMQDLAQQMLEQLQQMLENLQMAQPGQQGQQGDGDQAMQQLQDMIGRQQGLADRSFDALRQGRQPGRDGEQGEGQQGQQGQGQQGRQGQGDQPGQTPGQGQGRGEQFGQGQQGQGGQPGQGQGPDLGAIARDQEALRQLLDDLRQGLPGGNEALDRAEENMGSARDSLEQGDADGALQDQVDALDALREGAQELAQQQQGQPGQSQQAGREGQAGDVRDEDPFGRPTASDGPLDGDSVRVPEAGLMNRARELMDEIRRRSGDRTRTMEELEYLERLLDRF